MAAELKPEIHLEIAHVLYMDVVGYSKLLINDQSEILAQLNQVVRETPTFQAAEAAGKLIRLPTGDGMALVFLNNAEAPVECALEISKALQSCPHIQLRMGVNSGPINPVSDVNDRANVTGAGINMAQRVMDCADAGHILLSKRVAEDLEQYAEWKPYLHDLGEVETKHGLRIAVSNFYNHDVGNSRVPEKLKRAALARRRWRLLWVAVALLLVLGGISGWLWFQRVQPSPAQVAPLPEKSIAVLPFESLNAEKEDAFFADGLQDDVLTSLGKIKDLTVIARASVMSYRGAAVAGKLREIGQTLRVSHILQGSVRRLGNRVVVNVQLVDTRNDRQIWTQRYERTMNDALSLQSEAALEIARELNANLTPVEQRVVATKPTENPDAYVLYLRARELQIADDYENAVKLYQQAIDLDPKFALARARFSFCLSFLASGFPGRFPGQMPRALAEAEEALRLQPNLGEGRLALAYYYFRAKHYVQVSGDLDRALAELSRAEELMPNSAEVWNTRAEIYKRQDKLRERISALEHAETLDPLNSRTLGLLAVTFRSVRNWKEEAITSNRINAILPPTSEPNWWLAYCEFRRSGLIDPLKKVIAGAPAATPPTQLSWARYELAMLERDYAAAERFLREIPADTFDDWTGPGLLPPKTMLEALLAVARNADPTVIERAFVLARQECEKVLAENPEFRDLYGSLGLIDAFRGRKEDAIREGRRWLESENYSILEKNDAAATLALIYARTGEPDEAIKLIEKSLTGPANLSPFKVVSMTQADLKWRWVWDPLRNDPRFQKILASPEPKTIF